jgi:hypothetical protein
VSLKLYIDGWIMVLKAPSTDWAHRPRYSGSG